MELIALLVLVGAGAVMIGAIFAELERMGLF